MPEATVCPPSVVADTILRTIELGVMITDAAVDEKQTTIFCTSVAADPGCPDCGRDRALRGHRDPALTDLAVPTWGHEQSSLQMRSAVQHAVASVLANDRYPQCGRCLWITPSS